MSMSRIQVNGLGLNVERAGDGPPLLLLHGFTGSSATWEPHFAALGERFSIIAVDLIGHGRSEVPADPARYRMERCVEDLVALLDALGIDRTMLLGYSLGGRVALHLTLDAPERVSRLILESASPGIPDSAARADRVRADEALADKIEREGLATFIDMWERLPLFASQAQLSPEIWERQRTARLASNATGLANSLRGMGAGAMEPVVDRLGEISVPTLLIAGELDGKYCALGRQMAAAIPGARLAIVSDAGHAVHLEQPDAFDRLVVDFLSGGQPPVDTEESLAHLSDTERGCLRRYLASLEAQLGWNLVRVWLFGSAARGDMWSGRMPMHSDIDLLVLTEEPLPPEQVDELINETYPLYLEAGRQLAPQVWTAARFDAPDGERSRAFVERVRAEGRVIYERTLSDS